MNRTVFLQTGTATWLSMAASIPIACLVTAILVVNNLRDIDTDGRAGKCTLAVRFGRGFARAEYGGLVGIAFLTMPVLSWFGGARLLLPIAAAPLALKEIRALCRRTGAEVGARATPGDAKMIASLRMAVGENLSIRLDANRAWTLDRAEAALRAFHPYGIEFVEEPLRSPAPVD